jgi:acetylglutamate kinase
LNHTQFKALQVSGAIHAGMVPKLDNSFNAIQKGVQKIRITNLAGLAEGGTALLG